MDTKPTISQLEANWHTHLAGILAEKKAREQGMNPADGEALLDAAAGGRIIAGITFPPISGGFMMLLAKANQIAAKMPELAPDSMGTEVGHLGALALILHSPAMAWQLMKQAGGEQLFADAVIEFSLQFSLDDLRSLINWIAEDMARLQRGACAPPHARLNSMPRAAPSPARKSPTQARGSPCTSMAWR